MMYFFRGLHLSFWLFVFWVVLRVFEPNFEVSPLPDWALTVFIFLVLFGLSYWLGKRLLKQRLIDRQTVLTSVVLMVVGAFFWEMGLTIYLSGWRAIQAMFVWRFVVGMIVQSVGILFAAKILKRQAERQMPEGMI